MSEDRYMHSQDNPKLIAILDLTTAPEDRRAAVSALEQARPAVRAMPGCTNFRVYASTENNTDLAVVHEWADEASFGAYLESDAFARSGAALRPLLTAAPVSRRFRAELIDLVN